MKTIRFLVFITVILVCIHPIHAIVFLGPPSSPLSQNQVSIGLEWQAAEMDILFNYLGYTLEYTSAESDFIMGRFAWSPVGGSELFARLGLADVEEFDNEFAFGGGFKIQTSKSNDLSTGLTTQILFFEGEETISLGPISLVEELSVAIVQFAPGFYWDPESVSLYGGPMLQFFTGDLSAPGMTLSIEEDIQIGGFVGVSLDMSENCAVLGEFQITDESWAVGLLLDLRFGKEPPKRRKRTGTVMSPWARPRPKQKTQQPQPIRPEWRGKGHLFQRDENEQWIPVDPNQLSN